MSVKGTVIDFDKAEQAVQDLARQSLVARQAAYCPFSNFAVGAALISEDGTTYLGCNVENSSTPAGICAERTAVTKAVSEGRRKFTALAVCADIAADQITSPCGICRQVLYEFAPNLPVYCVTADLKKILMTSLTELLPYGFRLNPDSFTKFDKV